MSARDEHVNEVAVIGREIRVPGAPDLGAFRTLLREGREGVRLLSDEELRAAGVPEAVRRSPRFVAAASVLPGIDLFDAGFFGLSPKEAEVMDPQLRLFLEAAWAALEDSGYAPQALPGPVGVFAGASLSGYLYENVRPDRDLVASLGALQVGLANAPDTLAPLVSYRLNLTGPSVTVQTACSTSLVAVHLACQSLLSGECDMALAGGIALKAAPPTGYLHQEGGILSRDGRTRAFDAKASGTVMANGLGIVVLRRMADALAAGDAIHAVILGSAVNNDGNAKAGYTAPSVTGHARVVSEALGVARVSPESVGYVEAHGTATELGDPIEVDGLTRAFREGTDRRAFCALGSLKTNVGHLDHAAGVAGLIKATLALEDRQIPPSLHFEEPNPRIDLAGSPFYVNTRLCDWPAGPSPRRAGVSSLGIGGTNAHVILEEPPAAEPRPGREGPHLLVLSARSEAALEEMSRRLAAHLRAHPEQELADVAFTLQTGRQRFSCRRAVVGQDRAEVLAALASSDPQRVTTALLQPASRPVALLFPGQGSAWPDLRAAYRRFPVFRREIDACCQELASHAGRDLREPLLAGTSAALEGLAPAAWFVLEYALARLWMAAGLSPQAMLGEGVGEQVAACLAGVLPLEEALALVADPRYRPQEPDGRFGEELQRLLYEPELALLEVGPGETLSARARAHPARRAGHLVLATLAGEESAADRSLLTAAGRLWLSGVGVEWDAMRGEGGARRVPLPTYPFERRRYWVERPTETHRRTGSVATLEKQADPGRWVYVPSWKASARPVPVPAQAPPSRWLVLGPAEGLPARLVQRLRDSGHEVTALHDLAPEAHRDAVARLARDGSTPAQVVHLWTLGATGSFEEWQERGFDSLRRLAATLDAHRGPVRLRAVTSGLFALGAEDRIEPAKATLLGAARVLPQEHPHLSFGAIDVVVPEAGSAAEERLLDQIESELVSGDGEATVAYRGGLRCVGGYEPLETGVAPVERLRPQGVYWITGGLGRIGLAVAEHLVRRVQARLVLTGRSGLPPRASWPGHRERGGPLGERIRAVQELEALGGEVLVLAADAADPVAMAEAAEKARARFGAIHGVVHAAGILEATAWRALRDLSVEERERQLRPKVEGVRVLSRVLEGDRPDFVLLMSSLSTVLGGIGYGAYAAANAFLDAFAEEQHQRGHRQWISVGWDAWQEGGSRASHPGEGEPPRLAMTVAEALTVLDRVLGAGRVSRLVVSTADLEARLARWSRPAADDRREPRAARHPRPNLQTSYVAPEGEADLKLAEIWSDVLGIDRVGLHDNFFELGGTSLLAIQMVARARQAFEAELAVAAVFEGPTVHSLGRLIRAGARESGALVSAGAPGGERP